MSLRLAFAFLLFTISAYADYFEFSYQQPPLDGINYIMPGQPAWATFSDQGPNLTELQLQFDPGLPSNSRATFLFNTPFDWSSKLNVVFAFGTPATTIQYGENTQKAGGALYDISFEFDSLPPQNGNYGVSAYYLSLTGGDSIHASPFAESTARPISGVGQGPWSLLSVDQGETATHQPRFALVPGTTVPEPSAWVLLASIMVGIGGFASRRSTKR